MFRRVGFHTSRWAGLLAIPVVAAGTALPVRAADPSVTAVLQSFQAMFTATSYRATFQSTEHLDKNDFSTSSGAIIMVRQGKSFDMYMKLTTHQKLFGKTSTDVVELITTAAHTCTRQQGHGTWSCTKGDGSSMMPDLSPDSLRKAASEVKQVKALGTATIAGQLCRGYGLMVAGEQERLWSSVATHLPVQVSLGANDKSPGSSTIVETFGNWNDPSLHIPPV